MPAELKARYTMDGAVELGDFFVDDTMGFAPAPVPTPAVRPPPALEGSKRPVWLGGGCELAGVAGLTAARPRAGARARTTSTRGATSTT